APRSHHQRSTRQVVARYRSADLPGQADGSHKPRAANASLTAKMPISPIGPIEANSARTTPLHRAAHAAQAPSSEHTHLESPCRRAAAHGKPPFITQHTECSGSHRCTAHTARTRALFSGDNRLEGV
ncbi:MAG: hypothetical protein PUD64_10270, partial [Bacteroidales bacterium]|nr:hypothetical protein [Bacteroidales bacterium]